MFSVVLHERYSQALVNAVVAGLTLFKIGFSWVGPMSLAVPYNVAAMRPNSGSAWRGSLMRFWIGLEDVADLQADLAQSLRLHLLD